MSSTTLIDVLLERAKREPEQPIYSLLDERVDIAGTLTARSLAEDAQSVAAGLTQHFAEGSRVLLAYATDLDFVRALFGCFLARMVAVPVSLPRTAAGAERLLSALRDSGASAALSQRTSASLEAALLEAGCPSLTLAEAASLIGQADSRSQVRAHSEDLAFLQYTSGSTGSPRGVMVSHGNIMSNCRDLASCVGIDDRAVVVSWLPLFHDLGLVFSVLQTMLVGARAYLMTPSNFLRRPNSWLKAISRYGGTHTASPNFGFEHCLRHQTAESPGSLRCCKLILSGAEPVRHSTISSFTQSKAKGEAELNPTPIFW